MDNSCKTAIINNQLAQLNIPVACLQETRLSNSWSTMETTPSSGLQGLSQYKLRQYSIGFAVRNSFIATTETPSGGSSRILAHSMKTSAGFVNIISAYAPTLSSTPEAKYQFYEALQETLSGIPNSKGIYLLGDFNAHIWTDWQAWPTCLGHFGIGRMTENGQRLLELCCHHGLCITNSTNSYFKCKELHKVSWRHTWSHPWHQVDLVITRRADLSSVLHTRSYYSADCDTDHSLVASKVRLKPRKIQDLGSPPHQHLWHFSLQEKLAVQPTTSSPDAKWSHLCDAIDDSAMAAFGKKESKNADWFEACWEEMQPVTEAKRKAMLAHKQNPSPGKGDTLQAARSKAQQTACRCANEYWQNLCVKIQLAADCGHARGRKGGV